MIARNFILKLAPTLSAYLLLVSLGLPLQRVYCACVGEQWVSLPTEVHECHHAAVAKASQHVHGDNACCHPTEEGEQSLAKSLHDCGDTDILLAQLDADFIWEQDKLTLPVAASLSTLPPFFAQGLTRRAIPKSTPIRGPTPPPLPAGRDLLVAQQTFLI